MHSIEEILDESAQLIAQKEFSKAAALLEKANAFEHENKEVLKNLGLCYVNLGQYEQGTAIFEKLTQLDDKDATSWFYLASCQEKTGREDFAAHSYTKVIEMRNEFWDSYKNLSVLLLKQGMHIEVVNMLDKVLATNKDDYQFHYLIATAHMALGRYGEAIKHLKKAHELNPSHQQILNNIGSCYLATREWDLSQEYFEKALKIDPKDASTNYSLGTLYQLKNEYKKALKYFEESYKLQPDVSSLAALAFCAIQAEEYELAAELYKNLVALHPEKQVYQSNLMSALVKIGEFSEALKIAKKLIELNPKSVELNKKLGQLYRLNNQPYQAFEILSNVITRGKIDAEVYTEHALAAIMLEDFETAKNSYRKVIQLEPKNAIAHRDLALLYLNLNLVDWAKDEMKTAMELDKENPEVLIGYATYLHKTQEFEQADEYYKKAIEKNPYDWEYHLCYGINLTFLNKLQDSVSSFEKSLELAPENQEVKYYLAKSYYSLKKYAKAEKLLAQIPEIPYNIEAQNLLALTYMGLKNWWRAKVIFDGIIEKSPKNHLVLVNAAKCSLKLNRPDEAKDLARRALEIFSDFEDALKILKKAEAVDEQGE